MPPGDGTTVKKNQYGEPVFWVRQGDILIISTHRAEVDAILAAKRDGTGLGRSARTPLHAHPSPRHQETVAYTYLSDPFIRKLVGPATKIGQLRRSTSAATLKQPPPPPCSPNSTASATRPATSGNYGPQIPAPGPHRHGHHPRPRSRQHLRHLRHPPPHALARPRTGRLVTPEERDAYKQYLASYNHFWRNFFDPIAIRYEQKPGSRHELETFILPLIDNSLYSGIREAVTTADKPLQVPVIEPAPVALLSVNLNDSSWLHLIEEFSDSLTETLRLDGSILDLLGPDVHVAIHDADPIINIGNGELAGLFSQFSGMDNSGMFAISTAISMLTRPSSICIGLGDPDEPAASLQVRRGTAPTLPRI